jgi:methylase of polypeptide subunit release factors
MAHLLGGTSLHTPPQHQQEIGLTLQTTRAIEIGEVAFAYDERVLAPRPWTSAQSAWARDLLDEAPDGPVLELCCGAGHIGLLTLLGNTRSLVMVDASEPACQFALTNARNAGLADRVEVRLGQLETCIGQEETFPLVIADPPWVPSNDVDQFPEDPVSAIDGGDDGLGPTRACLAVIGRVLPDAGRSVLQVGSLAHVDGVRTWLRDHPDLGLEAGEVRVFGDRGVLVLLRRPAGEASC